MLDGDVNLSHFTSDAIANPRFWQARSKVVWILHPDWSRDVLAAPARVTIKTRDGREFSKERMHSIGSPSEPLTIAQFRELYAKFTQGILTQEQITRTADSVLNLENLSDAQELMDILTFAHTR